MSPKIYNSPTDIPPLPLMRSRPLGDLSLPPELRCMVYQFISFETYRYTLDTRRTGRPITLVSTTFPAALLSTCRVINAEAVPYISSKLEQLRKTDRFHFVIEPTSLYPFTYDKENFADYVVKARDTGASIYTLPRNAFPAYRFDMDSANDFVRKVAMATSNPYPETTTMAIRFCKDASKASLPIDFNGPFFNLLNTKPAKKRLRKLVPRLVKVCDVKELVNEGREKQLHISRE